MSGRGIATTSSLVGRYVSTTIYSQTTKNNVGHEGVVIYDVAIINSSNEPEVFLWFINQNNIILKIRLSQQVTIHPEKELRHNSYWTARANSQTHKYNPSTDDPKTMDQTPTPTPAPAPPFFWGG